MTTDNPFLSMETSLCEARDLAVALQMMLSGFDGLDVPDEAMHRALGRVADDMGRAITEATRLWYAAHGKIFESGSSGT